MYQLQTKTVRIQQKSKSDTINENRENGYWKEPKKEMHKFQCKLLDVSRQNSKDVRVPTACEASVKKRARGHFRRVIATSSLIG